MKYKTNPAVVKTKICGMDLLIPTRAAFPGCRAVHYLPWFWSQAWDALEKGLPVENLIKGYQLISRKPEELARSEFRDFLETLCAEGHLIVVDENE